MYVYAKWEDIGKKGFVHPINLNLLSYNTKYNFVTHVRIINV